MSSLDRALAICDLLAAGGVRATVDVGALNPPAVLVVPPQKTFDLPCGATARWQLHCIAGHPVGAPDRSAWAQMDAMCDQVAALLGADMAVPAGYLIGTQTYPCYTVTYQEAIP